MTHPTATLVIVDVSDDAFNALGDYARHHANDLTAAGKLLAGLSPEQGMALLTFESLNGVYYQPRLKRSSDRNLDQTEANAIYDLLVDEGGACDKQRYAFVSHFVTAEMSTSQYRFQGHFRFGGKFNCPDNGEYYYVDCYREDETEELRSLLRTINYQLMRLYVRYRTPNLNDTFTDDHLIGYCDLHCETERALFHAHHVNRMIALAGYPEAFVRQVPLSQNFISVHSPMKQLVALARDRIEWSGPHVK